MYCWGDERTDWVQPDAYEFKGSTKKQAERKALADASALRGGRTYERRSAPDLNLCDPRGRTITTRSTNPVLVGVDVTGSMQHWPREIFDRLPLLYQTLSQYREDLEVSFAAIGDATCDRWPLQVTDFAQGLALEERLASLHGEGGGGGGARESYELFLYWVLSRAAAPEAVRPFLILYGDEGFYPQIDPRQANHYVSDALQAPLDSASVISAVAEAWDVWLLRKPYSGRQEAEIHAQWAAVLGQERIVMLQDEQRAVDMALGIVARSWGQFPDFEQNMRARQTKEKVLEVMRALERVEPAR